MLEYQIYGDMFRSYPSLFRTNAMLQSLKKFRGEGGRCVSHLLPVQ